VAFLHRSVSKARFCAFSSGRLIVSPWAIRESENGEISLSIYIRHELSHVLLFQHKGLFASFQYPSWLLEGIAVYSADQMGTSFYPRKDETYQAISRGNFVKPEDFKTANEDRTKLDVKYRVTFIYSEFACMVDYLIMKDGKAKFLEYMNGLLKEDDNNKVFKLVYGYEFDTFILDFKKFASGYSAKK
jgi:GR25 family glycosyltransferase involved in LPS biosynthesis